jgi:hypothetical protein
MSPWVAAVESIVNGTVSKKEAGVPKGGEISNQHGYPPTRAAGEGWVVGGNFKPAPALPETRTPNPRVCPTRDYPYPRHATFMHETVFVTGRLLYTVHYLFSQHKIIDLFCKMTGQNCVKTGQNQSLTGQLVDQLRPVL